MLHVVAGTSDPYKPQNDLYGSDVRDSYIVAFRFKERLIFFLSLSTNKIDEHCEGPDVIQGYAKRSRSTMSDVLGRKVSIMGTAPRCRPARRENDQRKDQKVPKANRPLRVGANVSCCGASGLPMA